MPDSFIIMFFMSRHMHNAEFKKKLCLRNKPALAAASVPDKESTSCSLVHIRGEYFLLVDPAHLSKFNLQG